jgi:Flp pilus assembly protein TadB
LLICDYYYYCCRVNEEARAKQASRITEQQQQQQQQQQQETLRRLAERIKAQSAEKARVLPQYERYMCLFCFFWLCADLFVFTSSFLSVRLQ